MKCWYSNKSYVHCEHRVDCNAYRISYQGNINKLKEE